MQNVGTPDRIIRIILGLLLVAAPVLGWLPLFAATWAYWISIAAGIILGATSLISWCPIYAALGLSSRGSKG